MSHVLNGTALEKGAALGLIPGATGASMLRAIEVRVSKGPFYSLACPRCVDGLPVIAGVPAECS